MIPLLGIPVLNRPDLLNRLLRSIDFPVGTVAIIDNSCGNNGLTSQNILDACTKAHMSYGLNVRLMTPFTNLGAEPSWNEFVKQFPSMPYWFIVGSDVAFTPGDLAKIHAAAQSRQYETGIGATGILHAHAMNAFVWFPEAIRQVGLMDENLRPAYYGDNDYLLRCEKAGLRRDNIPDLGIIHGEEIHGEYQGSRTVASDPTLGEKNARTFEANHRYILRKWGDLDPAKAFSTPFNRRGLPLDFTGFDLDHWRASQWNQ